jgi:hypothetical protein
MSKIMELADEYARYSEDDLGYPMLPKSSRATLEQVVKAEQDYTRAVLRERDALQKELVLQRQEADYFDKKLRKELAELREAEPVLKTYARR